MIKNNTTDPKAFEKYFKDLIKLHYQPANYRDVPDEHCGDYGIECYTLTGHAFQCYLPEQVSDLPKLVAAQKSKINKDTNKLSANKIELEKLFGSQQISRWILVTSAHKSAEITSFCAQKSLKIRELNLPFLSDDFEILIHTEEDYKIEASALSKDVYQLNIEFEKSSDQNVEVWLDENIAFLKNLNHKLPKIIESQDKQVQMKKYLALKYLDYQNFLDRLLQDWTEVYEIIIKAVEHRQSYLESRFLTSTNLLPTEVITEELRRLEEDLSREVKTLKSTDIELIKWGVVSDWLIRCPLDF